MYSHLEDLELLMVRANELTEFRIDAVLREMATTTLCQLPQDEPWTVEEFLENTQVGYHGDIQRWTMNTYSTETAKVNGKMLF